MRFSSMRKLALTLAILASFPTGWLAAASLQKLEFGGTNADLSGATPLNLIRMNAAGTALEDAGTPGGGMVYPGAGVPVSTGSAWGTSYTTTGTGTVVALQTSPAFTTPSLDVATGTSLNLTLAGSARTPGANDVLNLTNRAGGSSAWLVINHGSAGGTGRIEFRDGATSLTVGGYVESSGGGVLSLAGNSSTKLANLTSNGFVKTSGGDGTLGVASLGTGIETFLATPSSANLAAALTDETGSGAAVFATSPTLVTPTLGAASGTSLALTGKIGTYDNIATVAGGVPMLVAQVNLTGQTAAQASSTLYAVPADGYYRVSIYGVVTTAATTSSTLMGLAGASVGWTDPDNSVTQASGAVAAGSGGNSTTTQTRGTTAFYAKSGTNITWGCGYASSGATAMAYSVRVRLERL